MSTLKLGTIATQDGTESTEVTNVVNGSAKAWVNFDGTGTVAIRDSENVSSITDNGAGTYAVNFALNMDSANYAATGGTGGNYHRVGNTSRSVSGFSIITADGSNTAEDRPFVSAIVLGGQA